MSPLHSFRADTAKHITYEQNAGSIWQDLLRSTRNDQVPLSTTRWPRSPEGDGATCCNNRQPSRLTGTGHLRFAHRQKEVRGRIHSIHSQLHHKSNVTDKLDYERRISDFFGHYAKVTDGDCPPLPIKYMITCYKIWINRFSFQNKLFIQTFLLVWGFANTLEFNWKMDGVQLV